MIIAGIFLLFAVNFGIFLVSGDPLNGVSAFAFLICWAALMARAANRKVDRLIEEAAPRPNGEQS